MDGIDRVGLAGVDRPLVSGIQNNQGSWIMKKKIRVHVGLAMLLFLTACAMVQLHPGAVNKIDSSAYDVLLISQAVIDQARVEVTAGTLPENLKPGLMRLIDAYNAARTSWLTYRNAVKAGQQNTSAGGLHNALDVLSAALDAFQNSRSIQ